MDEFVAEDHRKKANFLSVSNRPTMEALSPILTPEHCFVLQTKTEAACIVMSLTFCLMTMNVSIVRPALLRHVQDTLVVGRAGTAPFSPDDICLNTEDANNSQVFGPAPPQRPHAPCSYLLRGCHPAATRATHVERLE